MHGPAAKLLPRFDPASFLSGDGGLESPVNTASSVHYSCYGPSTGDIPLLYPLM